MKSSGQHLPGADPYVAPFTGAWIEIVLGGVKAGGNVVAPFAGAWIEITTAWKESRSMRVAPFTGAWIEIFRSGTLGVSIAVAPFAGAWIEILNPSIRDCLPMSLPSRERGWKFCYSFFLFCYNKGKNSLSLCYRVCKRKW